MSDFPRFALLIWIFVLPVGQMVAAEAQPIDGERIQFRKTEIDRDFRSEGVAVGDFDRDGKLDIAAGFVWYKAPDWQRQPIIAEPRVFDPKGYSNSFVNFVHDVNHDGWVDLMVVDFPGTPTWWFENPQGKSEPWKRHELTPVSNNESPQLVDLTGDGKLEWVMGISPNSEQPDGPDRRMAFLTAGAEPNLPWDIHPISAKAAPGTRKYDHGLGIGDVDGDGKKDIVVPAGWWKAPEKESGEWKFHPAPLGDPAAQMHVFDFDGDGDSDILSTSAHAFGIWWFEQTSPNQWQQHSIDESFSQTHGTCLADINSDGLPDLVTGKRWWAHGGNDPGGDQPAVMFWYELHREDGTAKWIPHQFDHDSGVGTQFEVIDVDADGLLDVVTSNKKGVRLFKQIRR